MASFSSCLFCITQKDGPTSMTTIEVIMSKNLFGKSREIPRSEYVTRQNAKPVASLGKGLRLHWRREGKAAKRLPWRPMRVSANCSPLSPGRAVRPVPGLVLTLVPQPNTRARLIQAEADSLLFVPSLNLACLQSRAMVMDHT